MPLPWLRLAGRCAGGVDAKLPMVSGFVLMAAEVSIVLTIPHPVWVWVSGITLFLVCSDVGGRLARGSARIAT